MKNSKKQSKICICGKKNCGYLCCIPGRKDEIERYCEDFQDVSEESMDYGLLEKLVVEKDFEYPSKLQLYLFNMFSANYELVRYVHEQQLEDLHFHEGCCQPLCVEMAVSIRKFLDAFEDLILNNLALFGVKDSSAAHVKKMFLENVRLETFDEKFLNEMKAEACTELLKDHNKPSIVKTLFQNNLSQLICIRWKFLTPAWRMTAFCSVALTNVRETIDKYISLKEVSSNLLKLEGLFDKFVSDHYINVSQPYVLRDDPMADSSPRTHWLEDANAEDNPDTYLPNEFRRYLQETDLSEYKRNVDINRQMLMKAINEDEDSMSPALQALYDDFTENQLCREAEQLKLKSSDSDKVDTPSPSSKQNGKGKDRQDNQTKKQADQHTSSSTKVHDQKMNSYGKKQEMDTQKPVAQKNRISVKQQGQTTRSNTVNQKNETEKQASQHRSSTVVRLVEHENDVTDMHMADGMVLQRVPRRLAHEFNLVRDTQAPEDRESNGSKKSKQQKPKRRSKK